MERERPSASATVASATVAFASVITGDDRRVQVAHALQTHEE